MEVSGKVVWITGASSGIGKYLAMELSKRGARLILSSRNKEELEAVRTKCSAPESIKVLQLDLNESNQMKSKVSEGIALFGRVDILVNNGGISQRSLARETTLEVDEKIMKINFLGTVALTKALLPHFINNRSGQFVTVTSMVGKFGTPLRSSYAASKHALHGFMDSLRAEEAKHNIVVTLVCPGFVNTNVSINALTGNGTPQGVMDTATKGGIEPIDFAKKMADAIINNKEEVYIAGIKEKFGLFLKRFFPRVFNKMVRRMAVT